MFFSIAGNIGSGKSLITSLLQEHYGWKPLFEPVNENPYLNDFYEDMKTWAFPSQMYILSRHCGVKDVSPSSKVITVQDRSIYEDAEIFAKYLFDLGKIDQRDFNTYTSFYSGLVNILPSPKAIVYLRADTHALVENIAKRGRGFERDIGRDYIEQLNERYDAWARDFTHCPIHTLDAQNFEFFFDTQAQEEILYTIRRLIH
jgi:deoxyadenosine/deoxycytidine kinase